MRRFLAVVMLVATVVASVTLVSATLPAAAHVRDCGAIEGADNVHIRLFRNADLTNQIGGWCGSDGYFDDGCAIGQQGTTHDPAICSPKPHWPAFGGSGPTGVGDLWKARSAALIGHPTQWWCVYFYHNPSFEPDDLWLRFKLPPLFDLHIVFSDYPTGSPYDTNWSEFTGSVGQYGPIPNGALCPSGNQLF